MALATRHDLLQRSTGVTTREIARTSRLVSTLTGYPVQFNKAVVGRNAFAHESGIHQHGVIQDRLTYEIMCAEDIGATGAQIVLGKHSGRHAFSRQLEAMGYTLDAEQIARAFLRFKELADRKVQLTDSDLEAIVTDEAYSSGEDAFELVSLRVAGGTVDLPSATVRVRLPGGDLIDESATGDGMVDAACAAVRRAVGIDATLTDFRVAAVTGGIDALGDVTVTVEVDGRRYTGRGVSTDVVEASARAFLAALTRSVRMRRPDAPDPVTPAVTP